MLGNYSCSTLVHEEEIAEKLSRQVGLDALPLALTACTTGTIPIMQDPVPSADGPSGWEWGASPHSLMQSLAAEETPTPSLEEAASHIARPDRWIKVVPETGCLIGSWTGAPVTYGISLDGINDAPYQNSCLIALSRRSCAILENSTKARGMIGSLRSPPMHRLAYW